MADVTHHTTAETTTSARPKNTTARPPAGVGTMHISGRRWLYLALCVVGTIMIANLQYGWSVFVLPLQSTHHWAVADIQFAFTFFIALETWGTPLNGWIADRLGPHIGPRLVMGVGGLAAGLGWILNSYADTLTALYVGNALAGFGAGAVYCTGVGTAAKWFPDHRGLAIGLVAGGFGAGAALTIIPIRMVIAASGYASAFFVFALIQGGVVLVASQFIRNPTPGEVPAAIKANLEQSTHSYTTREMVASSVFWVLYVLDLLMCAGGLMVTAYLAPLATSFHISNVMVFMTAGALSVALIFANVMNGIARPFFGWVADHIGKSATMTISFALGAGSYFGLSLLGRDPWGFIFFVGMVFFCWGNIFSLFPAMCTDLFGPKYATENTSVLYTAKGVAGFLVPLAAIAATATGNWSYVLFVATAINVIAVLLVFLVLRPAARRYHTMDEMQEAPAQ
jgi:MFS transporter, OFA family, oxalate/formate antiporter